MMRNTGKNQKRKGVGTGLISMLLMLVLLTACGRTVQKPSVPETQVSDRLQIGMSFDSFVIERWLRDRDLFELTAKELGADVNVQVANGDVEEQISQIRYFIKKKMDVIVIIAVDGEALADVAAEAKRENIRVVAYDRFIMNGDTDLYISFDNEQVGRLMAEAMKQALPDGGNIFTVYGSPTDYNVTMIRRGFLEGIADSGLQVVYSEYCDNWLAELAFDAVEKGLSSTPRNLAGVMCGNDDLAGQAFRALAENRLAGKVVLVGQDAELSACQRIVEGTQTMTVYKPVEQLAQRAAEFAVALGYRKMLKEGRISEAEIPALAKERAKELESLQTIGEVCKKEDFLLPSETGQSVQNGEVRENDRDYAEKIAQIGTKLDHVPYYAIEPVAVTAENMDEVIIGSDFHTREDVYRNAE